MHRLLLFIFALLLLAGCATSVNYVGYTSHPFVPKDKNYLVNIYPDAKTLAKTQTYYVIGKVDIRGFASDGINPEGLGNQARRIARQKGADAIINAKVKISRYGGVYISDGPWGFYQDYSAYADAQLRFEGELIVFNQ